MNRLGLFSSSLNPGYRRSSSSSEEDINQPPPNPHRVKRALFGPTDHEENLRFVRKEMKKAKQDAQRKWDFNFDEEKPIQGGRFVWEKAKASEMPEVYCERVQNSLPALAFRGLEKENRVDGVPSEGSHEQTSVLEDPLAVRNMEDLKTPHQSASIPHLPSSSASSATSDPPPLELGARPKESKLTKDPKKITELLRIRKSRSKLRLKRLGGGGDVTSTVSRSPSVKSRDANSDKVLLPDSTTEKTEEKSESDPV